MENTEPSRMIDLPATTVAVEKMLNAPYGSIDLVDMRRAAEMLRALGLLAGGYGPL